MNTTAQYYTVLSNHQLLRTQYSVIINYFETNINSKRRPLEYDINDKVQHTTSAPWEV